jgi:DNA modification methylase
LQIPNTESVSQYLRLCGALEIEAHPARFPVKLPAFFIKFLTEPGDLVLDIFAGSNTTGLAAETTQRRWLAFEKEQQYLAASIFRFLDKDVSEKQARGLYMRLLDFHGSIHIEQTIIAAEEPSEEIMDTQLSLFEL